MFTSWNLPDYLLHLQSILPNEVPAPLQIRGATSFFRDDLNASTTSASAPAAGPTSDNGETTTGAMGTTNANGEAETETLAPSSSAADQMAAAMASATESLTERGVKVKWPAKRMSVADMNKRVRALVEWVGREQALALERERRKAALESALRTQVQSSTAEKAKIDTNCPSKTSDAGNEKPMNMDAASPMAIDNLPVGPTVGEKQPQSTPLERHEPIVEIANVDDKKSPPSHIDNASYRPSTTKMMEELMEELISFQERFGPGAKGQSKERTSRIVALA